MQHEDSNATITSHAATIPIESSELISSPPKNHHTKKKWKTKMDDASKWLMGINRD